MCVRGFVWMNKVSSEEILKRMLVIYMSYEAKDTKYYNSFWKIMKCRKEIGRKKSS